MYKNVYITNNGAIYVRIRVYHYGKNCALFFIIPLELVKQKTAIQHDMYCNRTSGVA